MFVIAVLMLFAASASADVTINEIRIDQPSSDNDEYFELAGVPGESLDGLTYVVIGDGSAGSGVVETAVDLTGYTLDGNGFFVAAESTFTLGLADLTTTLNFENSDNVTHLLVEGWTGAEGDDLDTDDDCVLDVTPWIAVVDCIALIETVGSGDCTYCANTVGPDGTFVPSHPYVCPEGWTIGAFDLGIDDTPGADNDCQVVATGAGCIAGQCVEGMEQAVVEAMGGTYLGDGTDCVDVTCDAVPDVMISEIMYNPLSSEGSSPDYINLVEYVEIYNYGATTVDISGWMLRDEDPSETWASTGAIPGGTSIAPGEAVVLIPGPDTLGGASPGQTVAGFQAAWGTGFQVYPVDNWGDSLNSLSNSPGESSEILILADAGGMAVDVANFDDSFPTANDWPNPYPGGPSIYVNCDALDNVSNDDGINWSLSVAGTDGAIDVTMVGAFDGADVGSPGVVCPAPGTVSGTMTCVPGSGTLPFATQMTVQLNNHYTGLQRRIDARISVTPANGTPISNWRGGYTNVAAGGSYNASWMQSLPAVNLVNGDNIFQMVVADVTPAPYNQPPHPASGDTDTDACVVTGVLP
jgi:hypothetical protein